ncbi:MAG: 16S rRNA (guanine(966)-N(2))-methyltransferase RsmD [Desulfobacterales bacterium]|nr:16S rRNA (guanine(966)-N(2))-methyltransferase RsmD [Desulfobacterales bacterium]
MRITGGQEKGRHLASFKGLDIRPTSDLVREAIFDLIGQDFTGAKVLDLFAGTGVLGIEALSRGASWAVFIDLSGKSVKLIKKNLSLCGMDLLATTLKRDLAKGLPWKNPLLEQGMDLVFIDPPYRKGLIPPLLTELCDKKILSSSSVVVAESSKTEILPKAVRNLEIFKTRTYGETKIDIFKCEDDE